MRHADIVLQNELRANSPIRQCMDCVYVCATYDTPQDEADVMWHKPQMVLTHGSDSLRVWRQEEEPGLTFALWQQTPTGLR